MQYLWLFVGRDWRVLLECFAIAACLFTTRHGTSPPSRGEINRAQGTARDEISQETYSVVAAQPSAREVDMQPDGNLPREDTPSGAQLASLLGVLLAILLGVIVPICLWTWQANAANAAIRSADVGTFISAESSQGGFFAPTLSNVHTSGGSIAVVGTFSALRGRPLSVEDLNKSGLHLCVKGAPASCVPLAGPWTGRLLPTPRAKKVFNFYRYGLTSENFGGLLAMGILVSLGDLVMFGIAFGECQVRDKDCDGVPTR